MKSRKSFLATLLILVLLLQSGCAGVLVAGGVALGAGTVAFINGELKSVEEVTLDRAYHASEQAMEDLDFVVIENEKVDNTAKITALGSDKKHIYIKLVKKSSKLTEIRIRIATFGNQALSRLILEKIKDNF